MSNLMPSIVYQGFFSCVDGRKKPQAVQCPELFMRGAQTRARLGRIDRDTGAIVRRPIALRRRYGNFSRVR